MTAGAWSVPVVAAAVAAPLAAASPAPQWQNMGMFANWSYRQAPLFLFDVQISFSRADRKVMTAGVVTFTTDKGTTFTKDFAGGGTSAIVRASGRYTGMQPPTTVSASIDGQLLGSLKIQ